VIALDPGKSQVVVGREEDLFAKGMIAGDLNLIGVDRPEGPLKIEAKIRYAAPAAKAILSLCSSDGAKIEFEHPQKAITPGQAVVFYQDDLVIGGGTINRIL
jgi:tRNA-specific 2-thiouridylase